MKRIRITVLRKVCHRDLIERYENPIEHPCDLQTGQVFYSDGWQKPEGLCESAWQTLSPFVMALAHGATNLYDGWMKDPASAMLSCNDGFRPVSFLVEALDAETGGAFREAEARKTPAPDRTEPGGTPSDDRAADGGTDLREAAPPRLKGPGKAPEKGPVND